VSDYDEMDDRRVGEACRSDPDPGGESRLLRAIPLRTWRSGSRRSREKQVRDPHVGFKGWRICHHSHDVCCRGFWDYYKHEFAAGQIAQRLGLVEFVSVDILK
jgi:hypothetical protein